LHFAGALPAVLLPGHFLMEASSLIQQVIAQIRIDVNYR
jgi:hypothetical protein